MALDIDELEVAASKSEHIAWELGRIATAAEKICTGTLTEDAIVALIKLNCPRDVTKEDIRLVLNGMRRLQRFIKKPLVLTTSEEQ